MQNGPYGILIGLGETDSRKQPEVGNLVALSCKQKVLFAVAFLKSPKLMMKSLLSTFVRSYSSKEPEKNYHLCTYNFKADFCCIRLSLFSRPKSLSEGKDTIESI